MFDRDLCIACAEFKDLCPGLSGMQAPENTPECVVRCPVEAVTVSGRHMSTAQLLECVDHDKEYLTGSGGGVTFSGGEPMIQIDDLEEAMEAFAREGYHLAVDTAGFVPFECFERIIPYTDLFLYDIKVMDEALHIRATGVSNKLILDNIVKLADTAGSGKIIVRIPVIPGFNDTTADIEEIADLCKKAGIGRIDLLPFHGYAAGKYRALGREYAASDLKTPGQHTMDELVAAACSCGADVRTENH